ncbi:hypothetical protein [Streptomyces sp. NPDC046759]|uniref:hypothetical protein n=1 Tax=Streptomyces sp. NPDC046759 TaxID=3155019 RepID=UPI0034117AA6
MALTPLIEPMLAEAWSVLPPGRALPGGLAYEQKPDGYRALLFARRWALRSSMSGCTRSARYRHSPLSGVLTADQVEQVYSVAHHRQAWNQA